MGKQRGKVKKPKSFFPPLNSVPLALLRKNTVEIHHSTDGNRTAIKAVDKIANTYCVAVFDMNDDGSIDESHYGDEKLMSVIVEALKRIRDGKNRTG